MKYQLSHALNLRGSFPSFLLPLFSSEGLEGLYAQETNLSNKIKGMSRFPTVYLEGKATLHTVPGDSVDLDSDAVYIFASSVEDIEIGSRRTIAESLEVKRHFLEASAIVKLEILKFIGANHQETIGAITEVSNLIENESVRRKFKELEVRFVQRSDIEVEIDK